MYKIKFESQARSGEPDVERGSILLSKEEYVTLPELDFDTFDCDCEFSPVLYCEQTRNPEKHYPAVRVFNPNWKIEDENLLDNQIYWFFVCLDVENDIWIAFKTWDEAYWSDAYGSTVGISEPHHGRLYRLDAACKKVCEKFYN